MMLINYRDYVQDDRDTEYLFLAETLLTDGMILLIINYRNYVLR